MAIPQKELEEVDPLVRLGNPWPSYVLAIPSVFWLKSAIYRLSNYSTVMAMEISLLPSWKLWLKRWEHFHISTLGRRWYSWLISICPGWGKYHWWWGNGSDQTGSESNIGQEKMNFSVCAHFPKRCHIKEAADNVRGWWCGLKVLW